MQLSLRNRRMALKSSHVRSFRASKKSRGERIGGKGEFLIARRKGGKRERKGDLKRKEGEREVGIVLARRGGVTPSK